MFLLINDKYKYIAVLFAKSGCSTMKYLFQKLHFDEFTPNVKQIIKNDPETAFHNIYNYMKQCLRKEDINILEHPKYNKYYKFCIIRNTYNRVCSMYFNKFLDISYEHAFQTFDKIKKSETFLDMLIQMNQGDLDKMQFDIDEHYRPQIFHPKIDKYICLENLYEELLIIYKKLNLEEDKMEILKKFGSENMSREASFEKIDFNMNLSEYNFKEDKLNLNINNKRTPSYSNLLNKKTIPIIYNLYKKEIDIFKIPVIGVKGLS